jgi:CRISPR-associated protein Cmr2
MDTKQKYIGITIGPIYKTLAMADKTREIWGGSYLFSWLCKELIKGIIDPSTGIDENQILLPSPDSVNATTPGVGLYPDHIILKANNGDYNKVLKVIIDKKLALTKEIFKNIGSYKAFDNYAHLFKDEVTDKGRLGAAESFLNTYFQVYSLEVDEHDLKLKDDDDMLLGVVKCMNFYLDHLELRTSIAGFDPDPLKVFLRGINHSFLIKDAFNEFDHFPSLPEISTTEIRFIKEENMYPYRFDYDQITGLSLEKAKKDERENTLFEKYKKEGESKTTFYDFEEDDLIKQLFSIEKVDEYLRTYHKYIAIIHADGDRMGKVIGSLQNEADIKTFSNDLISFAIKANEVIAGTRFTKGYKSDWGYGGAPVYIGGDDLVFFAPVANMVEKNGEQKFQTVFHLVADLDNLFDSIFNKKNGNVFEKYNSLKPDERPCISYGISFTYSKHPLKEAFELSRNLMYEVKNDNYKSRNRLNFKVQKHSGQWYGGVIDKNSRRTFKTILDLLDSQNKNALLLKQSKVETFINSVSKKITQYRAAITACAISNDSDQPKVGIEALFDNIFNEPIHDQFRVYLNEIRDLLIQMLVDYPAGIIADKDKKSRIIEVINTLHGILRFIHFIRDNEFRN